MTLREYLYNIKCHLNSFKKPISKTRTDHNDVELKNIKGSHFLLDNMELDCDPADYSLPEIGDVFLTLNPTTQRECEDFSISQLKDKIVSPADLFGGNKGDFSPQSVYSTLTEEIEMPRYSEDASENAPLRSSEFRTSFSEMTHREDAIGMISSSYRRHERTIAIALICSLSAVGVMIALAITAVLLRSSFSTPDYQETPMNAFTGDASDISTLLVQQWPLPDVRSRKESELGTVTEEPKWDFESDQEHQSHLEEEESPPRVAPKNIPIPLLFKYANETDMKKALLHGKEAFKQREEAEMRLLQSEFGKHRSPVSHHHYFRRVSPEAEQMAARGFEMENAYKWISIRMNMTNEESRKGLLRFDENEILPSDWCTKEKEILCHRNDEYRSIDGTCNNLKHHSWGAANEPYRRILLPEYDDGISKIRSASVDGSDLPNPREISSKVHLDVYREDHEASLILPLWGQFVHHDLIATAASTGINGTQLSCCNEGRLLDLQHPECIPIVVSPNDEPNDKDKQCMSVIRSAPHPKCELGPRQQFNQISSFLDGSNIYGSSTTEMEKLRVMQYGRLLSFHTGDGRALLPVIKDPNDTCNDQEQPKEKHFCFQAGDKNVNEASGLTSLNTIWMRQHNEVTENLVLLNPHWGDEKLFQEARRIVIAQMQHITYKEFVPAVLGAELVKASGLLLLPENYYENYDPNVNPTISNVFAAAAFRFGHSMLQGLVRMMGPKGKNEDFVQLNSMVLNPFSLWTQGKMDETLRGLANAPAAKVDTYFTSQLTQHLFQVINESSGLDLVAINIQRGRDHGIPTYTSWREICGFSPVQDFADMENIWDHGASLLISKVYKSVKDVDAYTGLLAEKHVTGGIGGPTLLCLLTDQFVRLRKGDRFWYEGNIQMKPFSPEQLQAIRKTTLARVLCDNSDNFQKIQLKAMMRASVSNPVAVCGDVVSLPRISFKEWREDSTTTNSTGKHDTSDLDAEIWPRDEFEDSAETTVIFNGSSILKEKPVKQTKGIITQWKTPADKKQTTEDSKEISTSNEKGVKPVENTSRHSFKVITVEDGVRLEWSTENSTHL